MDFAIEQVLTQIVAFLIMLWVLKRYTWKPLLKLLEERRDLIASEFDAIKLERGEAQQLADEYKNKLKNIDTEAKAKIHEAVEKGHALAQDIAKEAREKGRAILNKAEVEMDKEIADAKSKLKEDVVKISVALTQKLIQKSIDPEKHKELITEALEQVGK